MTGWTCPEDLQGVSVTDELIDKRGRVRLSAILNYLVRGRGPLATTGCDHGALISTRGSCCPLAFPGCCVTLSSPFPGCLLSFRPTQKQCSSLNESASALNGCSRDCGLQPSSLQISASIRWPLTAIQGKSAQPKLNRTGVQSHCDGFIHNLRQALGISEASLSRQSIMNSVAEADIIDRSSQIAAVSLPDPVLDTVPATSGCSGK